MKSTLSQLILFTLIIAPAISCSEYTFKSSDQIPDEFIKKVTISDIKTLYDGNPFTLSSSFIMQADVVYVDGSDVYLQDKAGYAVVAQFNKELDPTIKEGIRLKVDIASKTLTKKGPIFFIENMENLEKVGEGFSDITECSVAEAVNEIASLGASIVGINKVSITNIMNVDGYTTFIIADSTSTMKARIPNSHYKLPKSVDMIKGVLLYHNDKPLLHLRSENDIVEKEPELDLYQKIVMTSDLVTSPASFSLDTIAPGIIMLQGSYFNKENVSGSAGGELVNFTLFEVDHSVENVRLEAAAPSLDLSTVLSQMTSDMAQKRNAEVSVDGLNVFAATNGNFNAGTNHPLGLKNWQTLGPLIVNGVVVKEDFGDVLAPGTRGFFGVRNDNSFVIDYEAGYVAVKEDLKQCVGGRVILKNGEIPSAVRGSRHARSAFGYYESKAYLFVGDGARENWSAGFSIDEMAKLLRSVGCVDAVYGAGAGNAMAASLNLSTNQIEMVSKTTNYPKENGSCDAWLVIGEKSKKID